MPTQSTAPNVKRPLWHQTLAQHPQTRYTSGMRFEWDEQKNQSNLRKHGLSLADARKVFDAPLLVTLDDRFDYGEERWIAIGRVQSRTVVVVYTEPNEQTIRIISLRKALSHERTAYEELFGK